jgi:hypothetical protein
VVRQFSTPAIPRICVIPPVDACAGTRNSP